MLGDSTSLGSSSCFYRASKLLRGTTCAGLKTFKTPAAAFECLRTSKPSAAAFEGVPLALAMVPPWAPQAVSVGLRHCYVARFGQESSKPPQQLSKALELQNPLQQLSKALEVQNLPQHLSHASRLLGHGTSVLPTSCFYWASKLLRGTLWAGLKTLKSSAAAFEGLRNSKPPAAAFAGVPLAWPW